MLRFYMQGWNCKVLQLFPGPDLSFPKAFSGAISDEIAFLKKMIGIPTEKYYIPEWVKLSLGSEALLLLKACWCASLQWCQPHEVKSVTEKALYLSHWFLQLWERLSTSGGQEKLANQLRKRYFQEIQVFGKFRWGHHLESVAEEKIIQAVVWPFSLIWKKSICSMYKETAGILKFHTYYLHVRECENIIFFPWGNGMVRMLN